MLINGLQGLCVKLTASVMLKHNLMTSQSILTAAKFNGQKAKAKEMPKDAQPTETKKGRELVPLMVGSYLTLGPLMSPSSEL